MITLNEAEQRLARYLAKARYEQNRLQGVVDRKVGPQSCAMTDLEGIAAEIAAARFLNAFPDLSTNERPDYDLLVNTPRGPVRVDVKATVHVSGKLLAVPGKRTKPPDAYVLMVGRFPRYRFAGAVPAGMLLRAENLGTLGYGPTYILPQSKLFPWELCCGLVF